MQSYEWGEFREKTGIKVIRKGFFENDKLTQAFQLTIHPIPHTSWTIGYVPKGILPTQEMIEELKIIGKQNNCIFIQLEPNIEKNNQGVIPTVLIPAAHPLFTKHTLQLDLTKSEEELLKNMHPKTRYNIKVAQKHGVKIVEDNSKEAFDEYWKLMEETTNRQGFFAHTKHYHQLLWQTLKNPVILNAVKNLPKPTKEDPSEKPQDDNNGLSAHILLAKYNDKTLTAWMLFVFHDILYYPYGASSREHRETMSPNLMMWEAILFGKKRGLKTFDMWGSLGENPDTKDPWYGFHRFKMGYNPKLIEFMGSYDLVINPLLYQIYKITDKIRWLLLKIKK